jgi:hypothetical protein
VEEEDQPLRLEIETPAKAGVTTEFPRVTARGMCEARPYGTRLWIWEPSGRVTTRPPWCGGGSTSVGMEVMSVSRPTKVGHRGGRDRAHIARIRDSVKIHNHLGLTTPDQALKGAGYGCYNIPSRRREHFKNKIRRRGERRSGWAEDRPGDQGRAALQPGL